MYKNDDELEYLSARNSFMNAKDDLGKDLCPLCGNELHYTLSGMTYCEGCSFSDD